MTPEQVVDLLLAALTAQARKHLPEYVKDSWTTALADVIGSGLREAWVEIIENVTVVSLVSDTAEIIDRR